MSREDERRIEGQGSIMPKNEATIDVVMFGPENRQLEEAFGRFPIKLYGDDPFYRPPSPPPSDALRFLARADGQTLARAVLLPESGIEENGEPASLIGWYESTERNDGSRALFDAIVAEAGRRGCRELIGPLNHDTWHSYRVALPSEEPPFFLDVYNKPWYAAQFLSAGFEPISFYHSSVIPLVRQSPEEIAQGKADDDRIDRFIDHFATRGILIRDLIPEEFADDMRKIHSVSVNAFASNPYYSPISFDDMYQLYRPLEQIIDPRFVILAESEGGRCEGFAFAIEDRFGPSGLRMIVKSIATMPGGGTRGLGTLLTELVHRRAASLGYREAIHALMHERNASANIYGGRSRTIREYHLYGYSL